MRKRTPIFSHAPMLTQAPVVDLAMLTSLVDVNVDAFPLHEDAPDEYYLHPWHYCTINVSVHYAGHCGYARLVETSWRNEEEFRRDPMYTLLLDTAVLDLVGHIDQSLAKLQLVILP